MASKTAHRRRVRYLASLVLPLAVLTSWAFLGRADAAVGDVGVTPTRGELGTTVTVSGSACLPGLLINPSRAGVSVATLGVTLDVAVPPSGAWSVQFVVPAGALPGLHAIVATCTRDLVPLPYLPLTFTVTAPEPPAPPTTIEPAGATTTVTTTVPLTTTPAEGSGPPSAGPIASVPTDRPPTDRVSDLPIDEMTPPALVTTMPVAAEQTPTAPHIAPTPVADAVVSAGRVAREEGRRPLVFGALSPIGRGWMAILVTSLIAAAFVSAILAFLWFRWLRHTRAREWWIRWFHQILRLRAHARPPT